MKLVSSQSVISDARHWAHHFGSSKWRRHTALSNIQLLPKTKSWLAEHSPIPTEACLCLASAAAVSPRGQHLIIPGVALRTEQTQQHLCKSGDSATLTLHLREEQMMWTKRIPAKAPAAETKRASNWLCPSVFSPSISTLAAKLYPVLNIKNTNT